MVLDFNANDIFEIAKQIERNGAGFYRKAAESISDPDAKQMLLNLAEMEHVHETTFEEMRLALTSEESAPTAFDPDDQAIEYLTNMAGGEVFDVKADPCDLITGKESFKKIIEIAIGLEKNSVSFYTEMKKLVPGGKGLERVDDIIDEENKHITILSDWL